MTGPRPLLIASDWNGTLVRDATRAWQATRNLLASYGKPAIALSEFRDTFHLPITSWLASLGIPEHCLPAAEGQWNTALSAGDAPLAPGAARLLATAHATGTPVQVISGAARDVIIADATRLHVLGLLGTINAPSHPKSVTLRRLREQHPSRELIYVGDTEYDIRQARIAGATPVALTSGYRPAHALRRAGPDLLIATLDQLTEHLSRRHAQIGSPGPLGPKGNSGRSPA